MKSLADYHYFDAHMTSLYFRYWHFRLWHLRYIFQNVREICLNLYNLEPAIFYSVNYLCSWIDALKKTGSQSELLINTEILLMADSKIRSSMCHLVYFCVNVK